MTAAARGARPLQRRRDRRGGRRGEGGSRRGSREARGVAKISVKKKRRDGREKKGKREAWAASNRGRRAWEGGGGAGGRVDARGSLKHRSSDALKPSSEL